MSHLSATRCGVWKCRWLLAGICAAAAILPAAGQSEKADAVRRSHLSGEVAVETLAPFRLTSQKDVQLGHVSDPVESLKQALLLEVGKDLELFAKRKKMIETAIPELKTITQLRRAYFLRDWGREISPEKDKETEMQRFRKQIGAQLTKSITQSAQGADAQQRISAAMWIADVAGNEQLDQRDPTKDEFARGFTGVVLQLLKEKDTSIRQAALHALGRITPSPAIVFPALKNTLEKDELGPRRLAAYA